ncbi:g1851 [Coccomyxa elongata]
MASASRRQHVAHATQGEDLLKANTALANPARRAQLQESPSTIHRNLENVSNIIGAHDLVHWQRTLTVRSVVLAVIFGSVFSIIIHKLNLTSGVIPSMGMAIALINFFSVQSWNALLKRFNINTLPFTPQENAVMQTCVGATAGLAFTGGFGSYLIAMDQQSYLNLGSTKGNYASDVYEPELRRVIPYLLCISLIGIFILLQLRKRFIVDYALPYPSGTASGVLINSLHKIGDKTAGRQMQTLATWGFSSFGFSFFKWFFSAKGDNCVGFDGFPTFGLKALKWTWSYDFSLTYIGVGMICPHIVNVSMMLGAIVSWGIMWPLLTTKAGDWYPAALNEHDFKGLFGYKVFIAMAVFLGDGLYNFTKIAVVSLLAINKTVRAKKEQLPISSPGPEPKTASATGQQADSDNIAISTAEAAKLTELRNRVFLSDPVPWWIGAVGYVLFGIIGAGVIPQLYPAVKWYMVAVAFISAPVFSVCNAYGAGLTDWDMSSLYGKLCIFAFAAWAGHNGGVTAGLAICGVMLSVTSAACSLMGDFKTGWMTLCSPRSMFLAQVIGSALGCVVAPATFLLFYKAFDIGVPGSAYPAPYATIYRAMAVLGVEGVAALPQHCMTLCAGFFAAAIAISGLRDVLPERYARFVPIPMAAAIPFYIGANLAVDMCIGSIVKLVWQRRKPAEADLFVPVAASGFIAGDGLWSVPAAILAMAKLRPPICMSFTPGA